MRSSARLSTEDLKFFDLVVKSIYTNPFGEERHKIFSEVSPKNLHPS
jgi:hypothetical protein